MPESTICPATTFFSTTKPLIGALMVSVFFAERVFSS